MNQFRVHELLMKKRGPTVISDLLANYCFTPPDIIMTHSEAQRPRFYHFHAECSEEDQFSSPSFGAGGKNYFSCCAIFHSNLYRTTTTFRMESVLCTLPQLCINELVNKPGSNTDSCFSVLCSQGKILNDFCLRRGGDLA